MNDDLFGSGSGVISFGKGRVYAGQDAADALTGLHIEPDFAPAAPSSNPIRFVHRKLAGGEIYFVDNRGNETIDFNGIFRVTGKKAELWHAETGVDSAASFTFAAGKTTVPLHLEPWGTTFVVFRKPSSRDRYTAPKESETKLKTLEGGWDLSFQPGRGAPAKAHFDKLISWAESPDPGIRYFSGAGSYTTSVEASAEWFGKGSRILLDLGDVRNLAVVTINGKQLGTVWHAPYRLDVTSALKPGRNELSVTVINPWVNRLIGDAQPGVKEKFTFTTWKSYTAKSPLVPSGLIGPVTLTKVVTQ